METNLITPAGEKSRTFFSSQIEFCEGNACAAGLLDFFDKFHAIKLMHRKINQRSNDIAEQHGDNRAQNDDLLQAHTLDELNKYLLGMFSLGSVRSALELLEDKGAISIHNNPNPRYKLDKRPHYLFRPEVYNEWFVQNNNPSLGQPAFGPVKPERTTGKKNNGSMFYQRLAAIDAALRKGELEPPCKLQTSTKVPMSEEAMLQEEVLCLSNDIVQVLTEVESNQALCEQLFAIRNSNSDGPESSGLEEAILTLQQRNEHCLTVPKRLRQEREAATKRPGELKRKGEHRVRN